MSSQDNFELAINLSKSDVDSSEDWVLEIFNGNCVYKSMMLEY